MNTYLCRDTNNSNFYAIKIEKKKTEKMNVKKNIIFYRNYVILKDSQKYLSIDIYKVKVL